MGEQAQDGSQPPPGPSPIQRLHESLINRIAAGEVHLGVAFSVELAHRYEDYT